MITKSYLHKSCSKRFPTTERVGDGGKTQEPRLQAIKYHLASKLGFLLLVLGMLPGGFHTLHAQHTRLTLEEALSIGHSRGGLSAQYQYASEAARQNIQFQKADYWPSLRFRANVSHANQAPRIPVEFENDTVLARQGTRDTFISRFELEQLVYDFGKTKHAVKAADWQAQAVEADYDRQLFELRNQIRRQFYQSLYFQKLDSMYAGIIPYAGELKRISKVKAENGVALPPEVLQAQVDLQDYRAKQVSAQSKYRQTLVQLAYLMGRDKVDFDTDGELPELPDRDDLSAYYPALYQLMLEHRSDIDQLTFQSEQQVALSKSIDALKYPAFMLQSDFSYFGPDAFGYYSNLSSRGLDPVNWRVGIGFTYTLFDGFRIRSQKRQALALHKQFQEQAMRLENQASARIKMILNDLENLRVLAQSNRLLIDQIDVSIATAKTAFENGNIPRLEYLKAIMPRVSAQASLLKTQADIAEGLAQLEQTVGADISQVLQ